METFSFFAFSIVVNQKVTLLSICRNSIVVYKQKRHVCCDVTAELCGGVGAPHIYMSGPSPPLARAKLAPYARQRLWP